MSQLRGIEADFATWRPVQGRKVLQLIFEVPIEQTENVMKMLGVPQPGDSKWCAIALLQASNASGSPKELVRESDTSPDTPANNDEHKVEDSARSPKKWSEYSRSQQAAILCADPEFQRYLKVTNETDAAVWLKDHFRIGSRAVLSKPENHARWDEFLALFRLWQERHK